MARHNSLDLATLELHIRLSQREGVHVVSLVQVCKRMIDESVRSFVSSDNANDVQHVGVLAQSPIVNSDAGCCKIFPFG